MVQCRMVRFGCIRGIRRPVVLAGPGSLVESAGQPAALLEGGNLLLDVVLFNGEVLRAKTRDIVSFAIRDGNIELHKNDVYAKTRCFVLGRGPRYGGQRQKETHRK